MNRVGLNVVEEQPTQEWISGTAIVHSMRWRPSSGRPAAALEGQP
ncbi:unnamed protein product [Choristocarpus tenellus]